MHICEDALNDFKALQETHPLPRYRIAQLHDWLYKHRSPEPEQMTNLPKPLRAAMSQLYQPALPQLQQVVKGEDGTQKILFRSSHGMPMETVIMRYANRTSLCVSSQIGCKLACSFCQTGKLGFIRNLSYADIIGQFLGAQQLITQEADYKPISHVVFMGMGEPLDNYDAAIQAANSLIHNFGLSAKNVTISTSGLVPQIRCLTYESPAALAISLHAAQDDLRSTLMPINRKHPLAELKAALLDYQRATGKKITFEYILIKDMNCNISHAKALVKFIHGLRVKVNLIPFNAHPGMDYEAPTQETIRAFQEYLSHRSIPAPVRYSKGLDVSAACGQLAAKHATELNTAPSRQRLVQRPATAQSSCEVSQL